MKIGRKKKMKRFSVLIVVLFSLSSWVQAADYSQRKDVQDFVQRVASEHNMDAKALMAIIAQGQKKDKILEAISRPAEKKLNWGQYRNIFLEPKRIQQGVEFWREHKTLIDEISSQYQVAPEIIVAIIGVETRYGRLTGGYRVLDALLTLGFDYPKRGKFFRSELEQFLIMAKEQGLDATKLTGSYAGAMGYGQFIPSSYRHFAVDYDKDGVADIWTNPADAIASVANYFSKHRWSYGDLVAVPVTLKEGSKVEDKWLMKSVKPKLNASALRNAGITIPQQIADTEKVVLLAMIRQQVESIGWDLTIFIQLPVIIIASCMPWQHFNLANY